MAPTRERKPRASSRNPDLIRGVGKYSRSKMYHKRGLWAIKAKNGGVFPRHDPKPSPAKPQEKPPKFYPADDIKKPILNRRKHKPTKLRSEPFLARIWLIDWLLPVFLFLFWVWLSDLMCFRASITPGTVLIILAGRFMGKRVVFLKQLPSGLLLVTGERIGFCFLTSFIICICWWGIAIWFLEMKCEWMEKKIIWAIL